MNYNIHKKRQELVELKRKFHLREDWHEPDESGIYATISGKDLDNACGESLGCNEYVVRLRRGSKDGKEIMRINLATLLAVASY